MSSMLSNVKKVKVIVIGYDKDGREISRREKESDLIVNQFGVWLASFIRAVSGANTSVVMKDTGGVDRTFWIYLKPAGDYFNLNAVIGTQIGVGSSSQTPTRSDYNLISQLGALAGTTDGAWISATGQITFSGQVVLVAGGTVREVALFAVWKDSGGNVRTCMLFRDVIADVPIAPGGTALAQYTLQL